MVTRPAVLFFTVLQISADVREEPEEKINCPDLSESFLFGPAQATPVNTHLIHLQSARSTVTYTKLDDKSTTEPRESYPTPSFHTEHESSNTSCIATLNTENETQESKLEILLRKYSDGKIIKRVFKYNNGFLNDGARKLLVHLIIQSELDEALATLSNDGLEKLNDFTISSATFDRYAHEIQKLFDMEHPGTYFHAFKSVNGVRVLAHGKLWDHYVYVKGVLREQGILEVRRPKTQGTQKSVTVIDEEKVQLEGLKTHCEPWEQLSDVWRKTHEVRRTIILTGNNSIFDYSREILALRLQIGSKLLECDFNQLWPERHSILFDTWETVKSHLIFKLCRAKNIRDVDDKAYVHLLPTLSGDQQTSVIFLLLPYILPSDRIKSRKRKATATKETPEQNATSTTVDNHKSSLQERRESFTLRVPTAAVLNTAIERQKEYLRARGLSLQPTPVIVGPVTNIEASYVVIDDITYRTESYLHAMDLTFKIFYATNCEYPEQARSLWLFLQKGIYNIDCPTDKFPVPVNVLAGEVRQLLARKS